MNMLTPGRDALNPPHQIDPSARLEAEPEQLSVLKEYLRIGWRWRLVIAGVTAAFVVLGLIASLLMTPQYKATATIEISRDSDNVTNIQGIESDVSTGDQEFYQTQYGLLRSRTLAERVANELNLVDDPEFFEMYGSPSGSAFELSNGRYPSSGRSKRQRTAGAILLDNLDIEPTRLSRLVEIGYSSPDPSFARRVANAWAENFIQTDLERKVRSTSYGREQLQRQLAEYKDRLDESQRQLVAYASSEGIINLPGQTEGSPERPIVADTLATLNAALNDATADRIQAEARFRQAGGQGSTAQALTNQAINTLRATRAELAAEYQQMLVRFEPGYPGAQALQSQIEELDSAIAREETRVSGSLAAEYRQARAREQELLSRVNGLKQEYLDLRRRSIQYNIYEREADTNQALYDGLLQRFKEIGVAGGVGITNISIVDLANMPETPASPNLMLNVILSLLAGLLLGGALAFGLEQLDEAITDPAEVKRRLGLPLLGSIPMISEESPKEALLDRKSSLVDAYLAVYTSLSFATEHGVPRSLAVTSTRPAEGKSTTSLAIATILQRVGKEVVLVDGDMRSPSVHQLAGVDHDRGLSNFLAGEDNIDSLLFDMTDLGIAAMTAGPIPPNAAELLTGSRLPQLIERLQERFDYVVIDCPPVLGLADAPLVASRVEGVVYAVEARGTKSTQVKAALNRLTAANIRVFGCVLTKFDPGKSSYGYDYDYGYSYGREHRTAEPA